MVQSIARPRRGAVIPPLLIEFKPVSALWLGPSPLFPSEHSARWLLRQHRAALAEAGALAMLRGRLLIHPSRFASVIERNALEAARRTAMGSQTTE